MQNPSPTGGDAAYGPGADARVDAGEGWGESAYTPTSEPADHDLYRRPTSPAGPLATKPATEPPTGTDESLAVVPAGGDPGTRPSLDELDLAGWSTRPMEPDPVPPYATAADEPADQNMHIPSIGDYWPDGPREAAPTRIDRTLAEELLYTSHDDLPVPVTAMPGDGSGAWPVAEPATVSRRRRGVVIVSVVALVLLAGVGIAAAVVRVTSDPPPTASGPVLAPPPLPTEPSAVPGTIPVEPSATTKPAPAAPAPSSTDPNAEHVISAPLGGRAAASFHLVNGTTTVDMRLEALGDELYRISTPAGASVLPKVTADGDRLRLFLVRSGVPGVGAVNIALNVKVRWDLRMLGGTDQSVIDLSGGRVERVELAGGATRIDLTLPRPDGTLPVRMTGGVNQFVVHTADSVPVRVRVGSGAGRVVLDGRQRNGIAPGASFTTARWSHGGDRIDLDAVAGMATLTVD